MAQYILTLGSFWKKAVSPCQTHEDGKYGEIAKLEPQEPQSLFLLSEEYRTSVLCSFDVEQ